MTDHKRRVIGVLAALTMGMLTGCGGGSSPSSTGDYVLVDLGETSLNGRKAAVNASGSVATTLEVNVSYNYSEPHAFVWTRGVRKDIHPPGIRPYSMAIDVNDSGQVALIASDVVIADDPDAVQFRANTRAYVYSNGSYSEIRPDGDYYGMLPRGIAADGTVAGTYIVDDGKPVATRRAFVWRDGVMTLLPGNDVGGINAQGEVLVRQGDVWSLRYPDGRTVPVSDLVPPGTGFFANSLGEGGAILGAAPRTDWTSYEPAVFRNGALSFVLPGTDGVVAVSVNRNGDAAGTTLNDGAFLQRPNGSVRHFRSLFSGYANKGTVNDVNDQGQLVGNVTDSNLRKRVFLLTPRRLAPSHGIAEVTMEFTRSGPVDENRWNTRSVTGAMLSDRTLQATVTAHPSSGDGNTGSREFVCSVTAPDAIAAGQSFPVSGLVDSGSQSGVTFHSIWNNQENTYAAQSGTLVVDRVDPNSITFRLVNVELGNRDTTFTFLLNAVVTLPR